MTTTMQPEPPLDGVRRLARQLMAERDQPDPHALTGDLLAGLNRRSRTALLEYAAAQVLMEANRWARADTRPTGRSWKAEVTVADLLAQRYCVEGHWIELGQCNRTQVLVIAADYRDRAQRNLQHAEEFDRLAAAMQAWAPPPWPTSTPRSRRHDPDHRPVQPHAVGRRRPYNDRHPSTKRRRRSPASAATPGPTPKLQARRGGGADDGHTAADAQGRHTVAASPRLPAPQIVRCPTATRAPEWGQQ